MMTDKAAEARQLNLLTLLFAILAFVGILALGSVDAKTKQQRYRIAKTYQISERQKLERRRARAVQGVIASTSAQSAP
ncbi:carbon starvation protein CstA [Sphingomonas sp. BK481]|jgi:carbon starvation protein CstA|nr:carbon starvation protein CstA [Sphingomonas sp. BK481]